ncbi:MAG: beta-propeller fold lactonase family protein [Gammaproteobacteria bacterium]|nr:beta-propeller fold lactonase family protein [Gammaproteobacteria bacterium]
MSFYKNKWVLYAVIAWFCHSDIVAYANHAPQFLAKVGDNPAINLQSILTLDDKFDNLSSILASGGQFTVTNSGGEIQFLQALFYSNVGCSTLLGGASAVDTNLGRVFNTSDTVSINTNSTYELANNKGIDTSQIACMTVYTDGGNDSSNGISCQTFADMSCSGTSCTSNTTNSVTWVANPTLCSTHYAYITSGQSGNITKCDVAVSGGALSSCGTTESGFTQPRGIATNNYYTYIASHSDGTVTKCEVSVSTGAVGNCDTPTDVSRVQPRGLTINGGWLYVVSQGNDAVGACQVSASTGDLTIPCGSAGTGFSDPYYVVYHNGHGYVANNGDDTVSLCTASSPDGNLTGCAQTPTGVNIPNPRGIAINNGFAYIKSASGDAVYRCTVDSVSGALSGCGTTGSGFNGPRGVTINNNLAYVVNKDGNDIRLCTINSGNGNLTCSDSGAVNLSEPFYISFF